MGYQDPAYVVFDGDQDAWAYQYMKGWNANDNVNFDFRDAHDLDAMTSRAQSEEYVKRQLGERMRQSRCVVALIGEKTKYLYKFVRWELELAQNLSLPIIAVNINDLRQEDANLCPPIIRNKCVVHVPFKMRIIRYALETWPNEFKQLDYAERSKGARYYKDSEYQSLNL